MPFPEPVRERALVAAARHCCVCHRYGGVGVEVHHIIQEADGGANDDDNAIALCFDCHAAAGHYNPRHPKGTKYSPGELRRARDAWHAIVRSGQAGTVAEPPGLSFRYIIGLERLATLTPDARRDLGFVGSILSAASPLSRFQGSASWFRHFDEPQYPDDDEYRKQHPEGRFVDGTDRRFAGFHTVRSLTKDELDTLRATDDVARALLDGGVPIDEVAVVVGSVPVCGEGDGRRIYEHVLTRATLSVDLAVTNVGSADVTLDRVVGPGSLSSRYWPFDYTGSYGGVTEFPCPTAPLRPGDTLLVPVIWLVGPFGYWPRRPISSRSTSWVDEYELHDEARIVLSDLGGAGVLGIVGPVVFPERVTYTVKGLPRSDACHRFDPDRVYRTESGLECGSCPHAYCRVSGEWRYMRPVLVHCRNVVGTDQLLVPTAADLVRIVELEDETTDVMAIDGALTAMSGCTLTKGEYLEFAPAAPAISITGSYRPDSVGPENSSFRNAVVTQYLRELDHS